MKRRRYIKTFGSGLGVGLAGLAGCGSPGDNAGTDEGPVAANETETETVQDAQTGTETPTGTENATANGTDGGGAGTESVAMVTEGDQYYFDPIGLFVESGTSVTWENQSGSHSSTAYVEGNPQAEVNRIPDEAEGWNSEILSEEGATFSHTFEVQGTYDYYCIPHKTLGMVGRIVVGEPSGLEDDPPDGAVPSEQTIVEEGAVPHDDFHTE